MPRPKKLSATLPVSEFDKLAGAITDLMSRVRTALVGNEESRQVVERLINAGFLPSSGAKAKASSAPKAKVGASDSGAKRGGRRRHLSPIDPSKIVASVKKAGAAGTTTGQIADELGVEAEPLRHQLYKLRDAGTLKMIGKMGGAKYVIAAGKGAAGAEKSVKRAKAASSRNGASKKKGKKAPKQAAPAVAPAEPAA